MAEAKKRLLPLTSPVRRSGQWWPSLCWHPCIGGGCLWTLSVSRGYNNCIVLVFVGAMPCWFDMVILTCLLPLSPLSVHWTSQLHGINVQTPFNTTQLHEIPSVTPRLEPYQLLQPSHQALPPHAAQTHRKPSHSMQQTHARAFTAPSPARPAVHNQPGGELIYCPSHKHDIRVKQATRTTSIHGIPPPGCMYVPRRQDTYTHTACFTRWRQRNGARGGGHNTGHDDSTYFVPRTTTTEHTHTQGHILQMPDHRRVTYIDQLTRAARQGMATQIMSCTQLSV